MLQPVGLDRFAERFPTRVFDVGIAEQHATTSAAGLALGGLHPVVAVYATFLNRAFDQVLMDVALHKAGVTFVLDRAGLTGDDGASHNGMWDMSILQVVPGIRIAAPRDAATLRAELREAVAVDDAPTVVRFPKGAVADDLAGDRPGRRARRARPRGRRGRAHRRRRRDGALLRRRRRPAARPGHRRHRGRPALGHARRPGARPDRRPPPAGRHRRGQRPGRRGRQRDRPGAAGRARRRRRSSTSGSRPGSSTTASGPSCSWSSGSPRRTSRARWSRRWPASTASSTSGPPSRPGQLG